MTTRQLPALVERPEISQPGPSGTISSEPGAWGLWQSSAATGGWPAASGTPTAAGVWAAYRESSEQAHVVASSDEMTTDETPANTPEPAPSTDGSTSTPSTTVSGQHDTASPRVQAAVALHSLTHLEAVTDEAWFHTAEVFRRTFRKLRLTEPRHADLAQVVSDALRFTQRERLTDCREAMRPMERAGDALLDSFIPIEVELQVQKDLLAAGWKLTRSFTGRSMVDRDTVR